MKISYRHGNNGELLRELKRIAESESRSGSHDDTGEGAAIWHLKPYGEGWECLGRIRPGRHTYSHTSVQNSSLEQSEQDSGWEKIKVLLRERFRSKNVFGGRNWPWERPVFHAVVIAWGSYHYGSSVRPRCCVEVWHEIHVDGEWVYEIIHLEDVGHAWSDVACFLNHAPDLIISLSALGAFKEYNKEYNR